ARVLQDFPSYLQQQPLLGVEALRLARGDAEELCIELVHLLQKAPVAAVRFSGGFRVRIIVGIDLPSVWRDFANGIHTVAQKLPESIRIARAWKATAQPDNGDWLGL